MKPVHFPMTLGQKIAEVFVQILWLPISAAISLVMSSPLALIVGWSIGGILSSMEEATADTLYSIFIAWGACIVICWVPYCIEKYILLPKLKKFNAADSDLDYNVGASDSIKEEKVQTPVRNSHGQTVAYVEETKYRVEHDSGDRHEWGGSSWGVLFYCLFAFPLRCISLLLSLFAIFIPPLNVCIRQNSVGFLDMALDVYIYKQPKIIFETSRKPKMFGKFERSQVLISSCSCPKLQNSIELLDSDFPHGDDIYLDENLFLNIAPYLIKAELPYCLRFISKNTFKNCSHLQSLTIHVGSEKLFTNFCIEDGAFNDCSSLQSVKLLFESTKPKCSWVVYSENDKNQLHGIEIPDETLRDEKKAAYLLTHTYLNYTWVYYSEDLKTKQILKSVGVAPTW